MAGCEIRAVKMNKSTMALHVAAVISLFAGINAPAAIFTTGDGDGYAMDEMMTDVSLGGVAITMASASIQAFLRGSAPLPISPITLTDDPVTPGIKSWTSTMTAYPMWMT